MKILHVIPYMHPRGGGPPVVVDRVVSELDSRGVKTKILCTDLYSDDPKNEWTREWSAREQIQVCPVDRQTSYAPSRALQKALNDTIANCDLVHLHTLWSQCSRLVRSACKRANKPYLVMPHGMLDPNSLQRKRLKKAIYGSLFEYPVLRSAAGLTCTHQEEARLAAESVSRLPQALITPLGADSPPDEKAVLATEFFSAHPELVGKEIVLFLSRLHEKKGLDLLVPAFAELHKRRENARLLIVGSGEPEFEAKLTSWIDQNHVAKSVIRTGNLSGREKWQAMASANLFALSSYQENFALVVVDAMQMELPIVLSRRVNIWEDIINSKAGRVCELEPADIAQQLETVLADPSHAKKMGAAGRDLVQQRFTWSHCADTMLTAYDAVLTSRT